MQRYYIFDTLSLIYETETVTSGLCYIEDLIFLENNIV